MKKSYTLFLQFCVIISLLLGGCSADNSIAENKITMESDKTIATTLQSENSTSDGSSADAPTVDITISETSTSESSANNTTDVTEDSTTGKSTSSSKNSKTKKLDLSKIPEFSGEPFISVNENSPYFTKDDYTTKAFEEFSQLDSLGRCGVVYANICRELMPTEDRGSIGMVKPSGWVTQKYDFVDGKYLYNRCHLIGFQLSGENANERNLITGTRYMNVEGMLPFENMVADYVKETNNHVLYRVTPIYDGKNLVASGVQMEAFSVEDEGDGICFNVYVYNNQPGVIIDYATGKSNLDTNSSYAEKETTHKKDNSDNSQKPDNSENNNSSGNDNNNAVADYVINANTKKFHYPSCRSVKQMNESNKIEFSGDRDDLLSEGYEPCGNCHP